MRELIFVHGRSQQNKDATALKAEWVDAFRDGLRKANLSLPIPDTSIRFPYYGDTLIGLVEGKPPDQVAEIIIRGTGQTDDERAFVLAVLREVAQQAGLSEAQIAAIAGDDVVQKGPQNWGWVRAILGAIDQHVPLGSGASIALITRDVYQYVRNPGIRDHLDDGVRKAIGRTPAVVVSHSLGTVVAYNVLRREAAASGWNVPLFVTLGSPLAVTMIRKALTPNRRPDCVTAWFNAMDNRDIVALYPLDPANGWDVAPAIENKTDVSNQTSNRHGISGYLSDPVVAARIHRALTEE